MIYGAFHCFRNDRGTIVACFHPAPIFGHRPHEMLYPINSEEDAQEIMAAVAQAQGEQLLRMITNPESRQRYGMELMG